MDKKISGKIIGSGSYAPQRRLTNEDLTRMVDTSDEWIVSRTGIRERRLCAPGEVTSDMAAHAARAALASAAVRPEDIELIVVGTVTPDYRLPSTACILQKKLGMINAAALDIVAACAGFLNGVAIANAFIKSGQYRRVLVIGVEKLSSITDYSDRNTCVLFGDAAGAVIMERSEGTSGVLATYLKSDGRHTELLWIQDGGTVNPIISIEDRPFKTNIYMNGSEIFKHAVRMMGDSCLKVLDEAGMKGEDVTLLIPHQANIRIIEATAKRLNISMEKVFLNIEKYGNTSSASVPLALDEAWRSGKIKAGDIILMTAFGGGLTWGAALVRW